MGLSQAPRMLARGFFSALVFVLSGTLTYVGSREGTLNPCAIAQRHLVATFVRPYSGTREEPNLLEPVAFALARKKAQEFVAEKSQIECVMIWYHDWRHMKATEKGAEN